MTTIDTQQGGGGAQAADDQASDADSDATLQQARRQNREGEQVDDAQQITQPAAHDSRSDEHLKHVRRQALEIQEKGNTGQTHCQTWKPNQLRETLG